MKKVIFVLGVLCLLVLPGLVLAQAGNIVCYGDTQGLVCDLDNSGGFMIVYVLHMNSPGATAVQFALMVEGAALTWVADLSAHDVIGNSRDGVGIAFGGCVASPNLVIQATYTGTSNPCDIIKVVPDPILNEPRDVLVTDCTVPIPVLQNTTGYASYINDNGSCSCGYPVEETTWGKVKSLYR